MSDLINHPDHYMQGIECWDFIVSHKMGYLEGNIIKYVTRYKDKDGLKDLLKAQAYLGRLIEEISPMKKLNKPASAPVRINGAIPLPSPAPELWYGFPLGPVLDGRNCPQECDCSDHQCPEPQARPAVTGDDAPEAEEHSFLAQPAKYYDDECPF